MSTFRPLSDLEKSLREEANRFPVTISAEGLIRLPYPDPPEQLLQASAPDIAAALLHLKAAGHLHCRLNDEGDRLFFGPDPRLMEVFGKCRRADSRDTADRK